MCNNYNKGLRIRVELIKTNYVEWVVAGKMYNFLVDGHRFCVFLHRLYTTLQ